MDTPTLVDHYGQGVLLTELGLGTFEARLGSFDTWTGFAVRRWCPPLLDLDPHCPPARYLARRRELGALEVARRLLRASGVGTFLVDTGEPGDRLSPQELGRAAGAAAYEVVRLETLAQRVADSAGSVDGLLAGLAEAVHRAAASAVAFTSVRAVRHGLSHAADPPGPGEVRGAAGRWLARRDPGGAVVTDPVLLRHLVWIAVTTGRPLQLHLDGGDPSPLADFASATGGLGTPVVLLGCSPHHRQAGHLAGRFPHVYVDLGAATPGVLADALEATPFGRLMFSCGARGLAELQVTGARGFTEALGRVLGGWVRDGAWSRADAERVAGMVAAGNARRVYGLV
ncbi:amidohydrolase [Streptomyces sp. MUM 203J]|nr:amidohydrolase [Streptomyces sp. MUM 203J]